MAAEAVDAQVDRTDEAQPARVACVPAEQAWVGGDEHDAGEQHERGRREGDGEPGGAALVQQRRLQRHGGQGHHRQDDPPAQALEHDRRERRRRVTVLGGQAGDTQHVAPDGGGQEVADEQAREVVPEQVAQPGGKLEGDEHPLPAQRREHDGDAGDEEAGDDPGERRRLAAGEQRGDVETRQQERQHGHADREPKGEKDRPSAIPCWTSGDPAQPRPDPDGPRPHTLCRWRRMREGSSSATCGWRSRRRAPAAGPSCSCTASPAPRRTSPTSSSPLAEQGWHAVAPDLRGHGASDHPATRRATRSTIIAADLLALADALGWERFVAAGPLDGRDGRPAPAARRARAGARARADGHHPRPRRLGRAPTRPRSARRSCARRASPR